MLRSTTTYLFLLFCLATSYAQNSGDQVFDTENLHEVRFTFTQSNFIQQMESNFENTAEGDDIPYIMASVAIDGNNVDSVGVRFKGFTSYTYESDKKPIKIDFNEFVPGKRHDGLRKLNLNNGFGDASVQRDAICYKLMRDMGVKAPRTAYAKVYLNDTYWGLYLLVEQVDKEFVQNNFTNDDGNLFKNKGWSHFEWNGSDDSNYHPPFELKTNKETPNWDGFVNLMDVLNNGTDEDIELAFSQIFNIDLFLRVLAVDVATNNWDSYLEHGRNWYIYEDNITSKFHWIPWDYNFALGGNFNFPGGDDCEIFPNFFELRDGSTTIDFYEDAFSFGTLTYSWDFGDGATSTEADPTHTYAAHGVYNVCIEFIQDEDCSETLCRNVNTENSQADCGVLFDGSCPHPFGLAFVQTLNISSSCCSTWGEDCEEIYGFFSNPGGGGDSFTFSIDQRENTGVLIARLLNNPQINERYYTVFCDLMNHVMVENSIFPFMDDNYELIKTPVADDSNFLFEQDDFDEISATGDGSLKQLLTERIAELNAELAELYTCPDADVIVDAGTLVINELMASNDMDSGISDTDGEYDDWIELYNNSDNALNLSGLYLSDDSADPLKWKMPYGTRLEGDSYMILWADNDSIQFGMHTNFKLPKAGGQLVLSNSDGSTIDEVIYGEQTTNLSYARIPNGTGAFEIKGPTHAYNNESSVSTDDITSLTAKVYPVPAKSALTIQLESNTAAMRIKLFSMDGRTVLDREVLGNKTTLNVSGYVSGSYVLDITDMHGLRLKKKIIVLRE